MNASKSLKEVWEWKEAVYEDTKEMEKSEIIQYFNKGADRFLDKMGYKKIEVSKGVYRLNHEIDSIKS